MLVLLMVQESLGMACHSMVTMGETVEVSQKSGLFNPVELSLGDVREM